jgi:hypothetical protein
MTAPAIRGGWHQSPGDPRIHATANFGEGTYHLYPTGGSNPSGMETTSTVHTLGRLATIASLGGPLT